MEGGGLACRARQVLDGTNSGQLVFTPPIGPLAKTFNMKLIWAPLDCLLLLEILPQVH